MSALRLHFIFRLPGRMRDMPGGGKLLRIRRVYLTPRKQTNLIFQQNRCRRRKASAKKLVC